MQKINDKRFFYKGEFILFKFVIFILMLNFLILTDNLFSQESKAVKSEKPSQTSAIDKKDIKKNEIAPLPKESSKVPESNTKEQSIQFLKKLQEKNKTITTIEGKFNQIKNQKLFLEEIKSEAVFYFKKPGKFRCDYLPPNEMINYLIDNTAYMYVPENKQVDKYIFNSEGSQIKQLNQMLLGFGVSVEDIEKVFDTDMDNTLADNEKQTVIIFSSKEKDTSVNINRIHIWFDNETLKPIKVINYEDSGDETIIELKKIEYNVKISDDKFVPKFPKDVEIIEQN